MFLDIEGNQISVEDLVEIFNNKEPNHHWLREGYTLKVSHMKKRGEKNMCFLNRKRKKKYVVSG